MAGGLQGVVAVVVWPGGYSIARSLEELASLLESRPGASVLLVRGGVVAVLRGEAPGQPEAGGAAGPRPSGRGVGVVLDQMFRGFSEILERELGSQAPVEIHEVVGRGLDRSVRVSRLTYQDPAKDDYDVLKLVESLAGRLGRVVFFTGDKKLARQASALGDERIVVEYMPPNEYPGKEALAKAMLEAVRRELKALGAGAGG